MKSARIKLDIRQLEEADAATLRLTWTAAKDSAPPKTFTARLMRLALAWDAQAIGRGGETANVRQGWNRIIKERVKRRLFRVAGNTPVPFVRNGTRILKDWDGATHEVLVTECGAIWNGQSYSTLSAVVRAMTGTNRNGPKYFGLREDAKP